MRAMNCGKVEELSSSRSQYPSTARFAATSAILTVILSRSDRAPSSSTVSARPGWESDSNGCGCSLEAFRTVALTSKGVPNGRHRCTERHHPLDRACHVEHAQCERFYGPRKDYGRRAAKA